MNTLTNEQTIARAILISTGTPRLLELMKEQFKDMEFVIELLAGLPELQQRCYDLADLRAKIHVLIESLAMEINEAP